MKLLNCCWSIGKKTGQWPNAVEEAAELPAPLRRRLSALGRIVLATVNKAVIKLEHQSIPWVVSCRQGDVDRRVRLLSSIAADDVLSPTDFSLSVHNAIMGLFSIFSENRENQTVLSGGKLSFESGLIEAMALQMNDGGAVGYVYYDVLKESVLHDEVLNDDQVICIAMILSDCDEGKNITIDYKPETGTNDLGVIELVEFFRSNESKFKMFVAGGAIQLVKDGKQT